MDLQMILLPLGAAALGYFTNLLAIAMLFRPHRQHRIFGLPIPFTPGLIPKERGRLAHKIGQTFKGRVLTDRVLEDMLTSSSMMDGLDGLICDFLNRAFNYEGTLEDLLGADRVSAIAIAGYDRLVAGAEQFLANDRRLADFLPKDAAGRLGGWLADNADKAGPLADKILSNPKVDEALRELLAKIIKEHVGGLAGLFVNPDKIFASIRKGITDYLNEPANCKALAAFVLARGEGFLEYRLSDIAPKLSALPINLEDIANKLTPQINNLQSKILHTPISQILSFIPDNAREKFTAQLIALVKKAIVSQIPKIISKIDIGQIIEDRINDLDIPEMERIVMDVARKQLSMIAALGGVLGFVIGLIPVILRLV
ncbi:MAG: DUF445 family protein [Defluviitaleaceae bacterium]|nr:DUF445 family protein [Defluviitaleaceae bacterium]